MNQKESELFYLDPFLRLLNLYPIKIQEDRESPDFVITLSQRKIGIELTNFHSDSKGVGGKPRRAIEETWSLLQKTIMKEIEKHHKLNETRGYLMFENLEAPPKRLHKRFTDELIQLSLNMINSGCEEIKPGNELQLLSRYLKKFHLKRGIGYTWNCNHNVSFVGLTENELINTVQPKVEKVVNYKEEDMDELWLLVISGYMLSQAMGVSLSNKLSSYSRLNNLLKHSGYNKVYIYQYMFDVIYEWPGWVKIGKENLKYDSPKLTSLQKPQNR